MNVKVKKLANNAIIPSRGSAEAAGYDLYANAIENSKNLIISFDDCIDDAYDIEPHETIKIHTGIAMEIPDGYFGAIFARSGLSTKQGLRPANCVGVVDSDYRGEIIVALHNDSIYTREIARDMKVAQIVLMPYITMELEEVDDLNSTDRGEGGFGSTGMN